MTHLSQSEQRRVDRINEAAKQVIASIDGDLPMEEVLAALVSSLSFALVEVSLDRERLAEGASIAIQQLLTETTERMNDKLNGMKPVGNA